MLMASGPLRPNIHPHLMGTRWIDIGAVVGITITEARDRIDGIGEETGATGIEIEIGTWIGAAGSAPFRTTTTDRDIAADRPVLASPIASTRPAASQRRIRAPEGLRCLDARRGVLTRPYRRTGMNMSMVWVWVELAVDPWDRIFLRLHPRVAGDIPCRRIRMGTARRIPISRAMRVGVEVQREGRGGGMTGEAGCHHGRGRGTGTEVGRRRIGGRGMAVGVEGIGGGGIGIGVGRGMTIVIWIGQVRGRGGIIGRGIGIGKGGGIGRPRGAEVQWGGKGSGREILTIGEKDITGAGG